jgi:hypothetical protein
MQLPHVYVLAVWLDHVSTLVSTQRESSGARERRRGMASMVYLEDEIPVVGFAGEVYKVELMKVLFSHYPPIQGVDIQEHT